MEREKKHEKKLIANLTAPNGSSETKVDSRGQSYTVNIVGGVPQKVITLKDSPTQSPLGIRRPKHIMKHSGATRRISCKDLGGGDCQGWLWKKKEGIIHSKWVKRWFIIKQKNLYYYKSHEDEKAQGVIHLPGFTVSPAPEIKSKKFAFKAYHTGTVFYFASESQADRAKWMNKMGLAAIVYDTKHITTTAGFSKPDGHSIMDSSHVYYSESEDEADNQNCSPQTSKHSMSPSPTSSHSSREDMTDLSVEKDDLIRHFAHIRRADLGIDGHNSLASRASILSRASQLDLTDTHKVELHRRLYSLRRTLKVKQEELSVIEHLMQNQPITASHLENFKQHHPDIVESLSSNEQASGSSDESNSD